MKNLTSKFLLFYNPNRDLLGERLIEKEKSKSNMADKIISYFRKCIDPSIHKMHELKSRLERTKEHGTKSR